MKRFIVVGLGSFGSFLATRLAELGHDVVAVDNQAHVVDAIGERVARAIVGDATRSEVLKEAGARSAQVAIVSTGEHLAASILSLIALKDLGVPEIYVKVTSPEHERIAEALGASEIIFPERESAFGIASRITSGKLLQHVQLGPDFGVQEMPVPSAWYGKTLRELALPHTYRVQVVAVHDVLLETIAPVPDPDRKLVDSDTLLVAGAFAALERLLKLG